MVTPAVTIVFADVRVKIIFATALCQGGGNQRKLEVGIHGTEKSTYSVTIVNLAQDTSKTRVKLEFAHSLCEQSTYIIWGHPEVLSEGTCIGVQAAGSVLV